MRNELKRNIGLLRYVRKYSSGVADDIARFGDDFQIFLNDESYQRSVCMAILQIGELAKGLSKNILDTDAGWRKAIKTRDECAHGYWKIKAEDIWEMAKKEVPIIHKLSEELINELMEELSK